MERSTEPTRTGYTGNATIVDVAQRAGVSKSTVSNVLRGKAVTPELARRVRHAIEELGYTPSVFAQGLARRQSRALGVLVPQIGNPFYADMLSGMEREAVRCGYRILLASTGDQPHSERRTIGALLQYRPAGYLVAGLRDVGAAQLLIDRDLPVVCLDSHRVPDSAGLIILDDRLGMRLAVRHLVEAGHRRIAAVIDSDLDPGRDQRLQGYLEELEHAGIGVDERLRIPDRVPPGSREPAPRPAVVDQLMGLDDRPTAVVTGDDLSAIGLIDSLEARGLRVPRDISVVGFDDVAVAGVGRIALTTVRQAAGAMGERAAKILVEHLEAETPEPLARCRETVEPELVIRRTTAPPRSR